MVVLEIVITATSAGEGIGPVGWNEKIFEPLFTTRPDGTGMGLAICRRIIAAGGEELGQMSVKP